MCEMGFRENLACAMTLCKYASTKANVFSIQHSQSANFRHRVVEAVPNIYKQRIGASVCLTYE